MARQARTHRSVDIWPGFVDALSTLLLGITFLLVVFTFGHYFLAEALTGRDEALARLDRQIAELADLLSLERQSNAELRLSVAQLSATLQESARDRDTLTLKVEDLTTQISRLTGRAERAEVEAAQLQKSIAVDKEKIELQLAELVSLRRDIDALRAVRAQLEQQVAERAAEATQLRDRSRQLEARLATETEKTSLAQKEIEKREIRLAELGRQLEAARQELASEQFSSTRSETRVKALNDQIAELRRQLARLEVALKASEVKDVDQKAQIDALGRRLNIALAQRVEELSRYRSEFFGRLREALGDRPDITIVGDRFVFQSEVLFETGSAELGEAGRGQMAKLAATLREISPRIPEEIPWVIRIDGHTDVRPIATAQFPSNWELSAARAIAVTRFLTTQGIPAKRLAAAGFGEFQPLDPRTDEIAYRRNRRIEMKLTER